VVPLACSAGAAGGGAGGLLCWPAVGGGAAGLLCRCRRWWCWRPALLACWRPAEARRKGFMRAVYSPDSYI